MDFSHSLNEICLKNPEGDILASISFSPAGGNTVTIDSTFVDESLRGQKIAEKLVLALAKRLREEGKKPSPFAPML